MPSLPPARPDPNGMRQRFAEIGLDVPEECIAGVVANLTVLQDHAETLRQLPLDDRVPLALDYRA